MASQIDNENVEKNEPWGEAEKSEGDAATQSLVKRLTSFKLSSADGKIEVLRQSENSPLHSVKSFEELQISEELLKGIYEMGFQTPSKIQEHVLPSLLANPPCNLIAQSQSGTGKTAAFLLSSLSRVDDKEQHPQVLILSPTYELTLQTAKVAQEMAKHKPSITFKLVVRGVELVHRNKITEHVILGTPGKVVDATFRYKNFDPSKIKVFVLDEADNMINEQGLGAQSIRIQKLLSKSCQIMLFSATYNDVIMEFAEKIVPNPLIIRLKKEEECLDNIDQYYVECADDKEKYKSVANLFGTLSIGQMFIFCHTKKSAEWLADKLTKDGHSVGYITGDLTTEERTRIIKRFREGVERVLISTNLMARGIDVEQVTVVINYDLPIDPATKDIDYETYLHRIGRTGRFGKAGVAFNFIDSQRGLSMIKKLEERYGKKIIKLDTSDIEKLEELLKE